jgi:murein L,D-transpeptidase YcbB/YkuD
MNGLFSNQSGVAMRRHRAMTPPGDAASGRYRTSLLGAIVVLLLGSARVPATAPASPRFELVTGAQSEPPTGSAVDGALEARRADLLALGETELARLVQQFYIDRGTDPAWLDAVGRPAASTLLARIAAADRDGLCPLDYDVASLRRGLAGASRGEWGAFAAAALDVDLTTAVLRYLVHLGLGHDATRDVRSSARSVDVLAALHRLREIGQTSAIVERVAPRHAEYRSLARALARYRGIARRGAWPALELEATLRPGDPATAGVLGALAARLGATGDLAPATAPADRYAGAIVDAIRAFQTRHGLAVDGIVGPATIAALNVPLGRRIGQIALNMDRWRRLPDDLGTLHVRVTIPAFEVSVFEGGRRVLQRRAIVGTSSSPTPAFSDRIRYIEFNPYWNVPDGIANAEILPEASEDPGYLDARGFEVFDGWHAGAEPLDPFSIDWETGPLDYRIRQRPGPTNALGLVKFMFPNRHNVYLHDTPARHLFRRHHRALSHSCVRVEDPGALAAAILPRDAGWTADRVDEAMRSGTRRAVPLPEPVPVHLLYVTAAVDAGGTLHFRDDIYGRDAQRLAQFGCERTARQGGAGRW